MSIVQINHFFPQRLALLLFVAFLERIQRKFLEGCKPGPEPGWTFDMACTGPQGRRQSDLRGQGETDCRCDRTKCCHLQLLCHCMLLEVPF